MVLATWQILQLLLNSEVQYDSQKKLIRNQFPYTGYLIIFLMSLQDLIKVLNIRIYIF